jgi:hypothetical protein
MIQKPFIRFKRAMKPHSMIQAGDLKIILTPIDRMGPVTGIDQGHV